MNKIYEEIDMEHKNITVDKIVEMLETTVISRGSASTIKNFCSDTRKIKKGDLFISLKSEKNDGIKYIEEAFEKGAMGCITEYEIPNNLLEKNKNKLIIRVNDIIKTIQKIAEYKRNLFDIPVIAITGSVGKTSTKDMVASVLSQEFKTAKTQGNYNNHIGLPLTILNWDENIEVAVVEMGMNHFGEISVLTNIAKPTVAVITNVGTAHIGNLGSRENILKAKLEILEGLNENGKIIVNNDNDLLNICDIKKYKKITYGINNTSNYIAENIIIRENNSKYEIKINNKKYEINVPVAGEHFIYNSLCAIAVGMELGIKIEKIINGIKYFELTEKRNEITEKNNLKIINDYYNASYDSMKASLEVLSKIEAKRRIAILGDMLELGEYTKELHKKVGEEVAKNKIDILITVGELSKDIAKEAEHLEVKEVYHLKTNLECIKKLKNIIKKEDAILLKASNAMHFGEIANFLEGEELWKK